MKILLHIYPDPDGVHCGGCRLGKEKGYCPLAGKDFRGSGKRKRFSICLKAEAGAKEKP